MARAVAVAALLSVALPAFAVEDPTPELSAERDQLLDKIAHGVDYEASVKRFAALVKQRDAVVATSFAARAAKDKEREAERAILDAKRKWQDEYHKTADYQVSWRCTLSPDPAHPIPSTEGRFRPDWGRVVRKEATRLQPKNALDDGEPVTLMEVRGQARAYQFRADRFGPNREAFDAKVGDLVLICDGGEDLARGVPPGWGPRLLTSGFAVHLTEPPLITKKARFAPIHITGSAFFWAIKDVRWKYPPGSFVLSNLEIGQPLGPGHWDIPADRELSWVLEVPPTVKHQDLLVPGHQVWLILGNPRFDKSLKKLVLEAQDIEARYIK